MGCHNIHFHGKCQNKYRCVLVHLKSLSSWPGGHKKKFMLNSAEHEIFPAHNMNVMSSKYCWHFNIYEQEK